MLARFRLLWLAYQSLKYFYSFKRKRKVVHGIEVSLTLVVMRGSHLTHS